MEWNQFLGEIFVYSKLLNTSYKINNKCELVMMFGFSYKHPNITFIYF